MLNPQNLANGQEQYEFYNAPGRGGKQGQKHCQYDYRHTAGELFTCVAKSLEAARARRDNWLKTLRNMHVAIRLISPCGCRCTEILCPRGVAKRF